VLLTKEANERALLTRSLLAIEKLQNHFSKTFTEVDFRNVQQGTKNVLEQPADGSYYPQEDFLTAVSFLSKYTKCPMLLDATRLHESHAFYNDRGENGMSMQIPEHILNIIKLLPGNSRCCDCGSPIKYTNKKQFLAWASIAHGTIICDRCAFRHLCGGREKEMKSFDSLDWIFSDVLSMLEGGNEAFLSEISFSKGIDGNVNDLSPACTLSYGTFNDIYFSQSTSRYKETLREKVLNIPRMSLDDVKASESTTDQVTEIDYLPLDRKA